MDPPPLTSTTTTAQISLPPPPTAAQTTQITSPHSIDSRATDFSSFSDQPPPPPPIQKLRLMCSYNGHIIPRPHTKSLCYVGGETRMIVINRTTTLSDLLTTLSKTLIINNNYNYTPFTLKYQLPNEDLDSLITVTNDDDLDNMIDEYDRLLISTTNGSSKPGRIRLFLFPVRPDGVKSMGNILDGSEDWFLNAINSGGVDLHRGFSDPGSVNCLLGLENEVDFVNPNPNANPNPNYGMIESNSDNNISDLNVELREKKIGGNQSAQDVQSVPGSKTSSFGSTTSTHTPKLENLPQIKLHADEIEGKFGQMSVGTGNGQGPKVADEGIVVISSPPSTMAMVGGGGSGGSCEFGNRVYLDEERSDNGVSIRFPTQQHVNYQQQMGNGNGVMSLQVPHKQHQLGGELPSPDSVSSDSSLSSNVTRQKPVMYQDPNGQLSSGSTRFPAGVQVQQVPDSGYPFNSPYDPHQQLIPPPTHQLKLNQEQMLQQQQMLQRQQMLQQQPILQQPVQTHPQTQQQYIPAGAHFVQHPPPGAVPMPAYYPIYPHQQPHNLPHHYPVYYVPAQSYTLPGQQQPNTAEAPTSIPSNLNQAPPNPTMITTSDYKPTRNINMEPLKSEMGPGVYGTTAGSHSQSQPQPQQQHQFVGYSQVHHPSQSVAPNSGYAYEFADPGHSQMYYPQPQAPALASQHQGLSSGGPTMMIPEVSHVSNDSVKQQIRSSQPS